MRHRKSERHDGFEIDSQRTDDRAFEDEILLRFDARLYRVIQ